jgi:hypothetical protein
MNWISMLVAAVAAVGGYCLGAERDAERYTLRGCRQTKRIALSREGNSGRLKAKTTPPKRLLSITEGDKIEWKVNGRQHLPKSATVQIRFSEGASPLEPPEPSDRKTITAGLKDDLREPGKYSYQVWLKMPNEVDSYCMEDPELLIEI